MSELDDVVEALLVERFARPPWWASDPADSPSLPAVEDAPAYLFADTPLLVARRRRELAEGFGTVAS